MSGVKLQPIQVAAAGSTSTTSSSSGPYSANGKKEERNLPVAYRDYLDKMRHAWKDLFPLDIHFDKLAYTVKQDLKEHKINNLWTMLKKTMVAPFQKPATMDLKALSPTSGQIKAGTLNLILAPPGSGKSTFLKALAGRLSKDPNVSGTIRWNGLTKEEASAQGFNLKTACAYVDQNDCHFPTMTVRETFEFANQNAISDVTLLNDAAFKEAHNKKVDLMLELLGLKECEHTVIGNAMLRGVSGGQKKRVTLGEMMLSNARALFLDEISTGLDAAATFDIVSALKRWTREMNGTVVVALLQPAPEVYDMFDNIILFRHGVTVYHGPRTELLPYFASHGIVAPPDQDTADFLTEFLSEPREVWRDNITREMEKQSKRSSSKLSFQQAAHKPQPLPISSSSHTATTNGAKQHTPPSTNTIVFHVGDDEDYTFSPTASHGAAAAAVAASNGNSGTAYSAFAVDPRQKGLVPRIDESKVPLSTEALKITYESTEIYKKHLEEVQNVTKTSRMPNRQNISPFTMQQFFSTFAHSYVYHTKALFQRQVRLMSRANDLWGPKLGQASFMGLIVGSLFYNTGTGIQQSQSRLGLILFSAISMAFSNMAEVPMACDSVYVIYKQVDAGFYPTLPYIVALTLVSIPLVILECTIFGSIIYWMSSFNDNAGSFFYYLFMMMLVDLVISVLFRSFCYLASNPDIAQMLAGPTTAVFLIFGGFLVVREKIPNFLIWLYWISPFSWVVRAMAINEFEDVRYDVQVATNNSGVIVTSDRMGNIILDSWQIQRETVWKYASIPYLLGLFLVTVMFSGYILTAKRSWLSIGTRRVASEEAEAAKRDTEIEKQLKDNAAHGGSSPIANNNHVNINVAKFVRANSTVTVSKSNIVWRDLSYYVIVNGKKKQLLNKVNGYSKPGTLTALMGSSGAGKTTLMDVIAGRKTGGIIEGEILVNGKPKENKSFNRLTGYVEQTDIHLGTATVREALLFSCKLRNNDNLSAKDQEAWVDEVIDLLELTDIAHRVIGDVISPSLSPGQMKLVTIGVELVTNPVFLFLDEPTSGLDSRAAYVVMKVVKKISLTGRCVICTIHQPSAELFHLFDRLLLLKSGGHVTYLGDIGAYGSSLVQYFETAPLAADYFRPTYSDDQNPAAWMLDVTGAGTSAKGKIADYAEVYNHSPLREENMKELDYLAKDTSEANALVFDSVYAASYGTQFFQVLGRMFNDYYRNVDYNFMRLFVMTFLGILFGLVWLDLGDNDFAGMNSKMSAIFMSVGFGGLLNSATALPVMYRIREVFYRERASNTYHESAYSVGLGIVEIPYVFGCTVLFVTPFYFLVGFESTARAYFRFLFAFYLLALIFSYGGQFISVFMPNLIVANMFQGTFFTFFFLFAGVFISVSSIPVGWIWMYYIDPIPKAMISIAISQFRCVGDITVCPSLFDPVTNTVVTKSEWVGTYMQTDMSDDWYWYYIGWLGFTALVFRILIFIIVKYVNHQKR